MESGGSLDPHVIIDLRSLATEHRVRHATPVSMTSYNQSARWWRVLPRENTDAKYSTSAKEVTERHGEAIGVQSCGSHEEGAGDQSVQEAAD